MKISDLRKQLDAWEAQWTMLDEQYLGRFGDRHINVPVYEWNGKHFYDRDGSFDYKGYGRELEVYWDVTGLGVIIDHKHKNKVV